MKKLTLITAITLLSLAGMAQTKVTKDAAGNYVVAKRSDTSANKPTGKTITDRDGNSYPVMISSRGKLFYFRTSKAGNVYKSYIREQ
ncbi:MAG TPA: hypothetical protein VN698_13890 [Bacteroidia bacterium]|nr:hypothetical protein [Bacteroidia bacterium]